MINLEKEKKIEFARKFLQERIDEEFPYPLQVSYEDNQFIFRFRNGKKEFRAHLKQAEKMIACISDGSRERVADETRWIFGILRTAIQAQESAMLYDGSDYEKVKNNLILRPINYHYVKSELTDVPHIRIGDMALVLYAVIAHADRDYFTTKMHRSYMEKWKQPEGKVLEAALANTAIMYPPRLCSVEDFLIGDGKQNEDGMFMTDDEPLKIRKGIPYFLTNTLELNGAIAMFYPGVARKIAECFGEDFYIAFTSIHDAQIHNASMISHDVVRSSLRDTNKHCNRKEDVLTNQVYCYSLEKKSFGMIRQDGSIDWFKW